MSTWISRVAGPILLLTALSACAGLNDAAATRISVMDGSVALAAPRGYCVDRTALRDTTRGAFVLFGSCAALAPGPFSPAPRPRAVLTATVAPPRAGAAPPPTEWTERMTAFVASTDGRRALSRDRTAGSVQILRTRVDDGVFYIRLRDSSATAGPRVAPDYWRAILDIDRHMITLSILALEDASIDAATGESVIRIFAKRVRAANRP